MTRTILSDEDLARMEAQANLDNQYRRVTVRIDPREILRLIEEVKRRRETAKRQIQEALDV